MTTKEYDWLNGAELLDHTKRKLKILDDYLFDYLMIRCQLPQQQKFRLAIVDGFAGGGRYRCGSAGSPIIFIEGLERALNKINIDRTIKGLREINAVAQFEHNLLIEKAELTRAKAERKRIGRPPALSDDDQDFVRVALMVGKPVAAIARDMGVSRQTTLRVRQAM